MNSRQELAADIITTYIQGPRLAEAMDLLEGLIGQEESDGLRADELAHRVLDLL